MYNWDCDLWRYYERVVEVVKKANPQAKILISLGGWADSAGDKYSRYNYSILTFERVWLFAIKLAIAKRYSYGPFVERKQIEDSEQQK
jgi:hypothetical protein